MKIECDECGRSLEVPAGADEVRCECGGMVHLPDAGAGEGEVVSAEDLARKWYYARDGERYGPVPLAGLRKLVRDGKLSGENLIWSRGMDTWERADSIPRLEPVFRDDGDMSRVSARHEALDGGGAEEQRVEVTDRPEEAALMPDLPSGSEHRAKSGDSDEGGGFFIAVVAGLMTAFGLSQLFAAGFVVYLKVYRGLEFERCVFLVTGLLAGALIFLGLGRGMAMIAKLRREVDLLHARMEGSRDD